MDKYDKLMNGAFTLVFILIFLVFIFGGIDFVKDNPMNTMLISVGMLTFVSIFYNLEKLSNMYSGFSRELDKIQKKTKKNIIKSNLNPLTLREGADQLEEIESYKNRANVEKWLKFSILFYLATMISLLIKPLSERLDPLRTFIQAILFHAGLLFTLYLFFALLIISQQPKK